MIGDDEFVDGVLQQHERETVKQWQRRPALDAIVAVIEKRHEVTFAELKSFAKSRSISQARKVFSILAHDRGYKVVEIGRYLDKYPSEVTIYLRERGDADRDVEEAVIKAPQHTREGLNSLVCV